MNTSTQGYMPGQVTPNEDDTSGTTIATTVLPTTNYEVLKTIFSGNVEPQRPFVLGFAGAPKDCKSWGGEAWQIQNDATDNPALNWYFTLATYRPSDDCYHRRERDCAAIHGVMLDDIGTKALPLDRLKACPPSYVIETSEGNFQVAYLFTQPVTELAAVKALNQSMVDAGLCDPGAKSPATRYGRLPFAHNGKTTPTFQCRLVEWHPERRYTVEEIMECLELPPQSDVDKTGHKPASGDDVYTPKSKENGMITALKTRGLYKRPLGNGLHDITCPWVHEHTDQVDNGSAYFEPTESYPLGGFRCQHSHGDKFRIGALVEYLGLNFQTAKHKPLIMTAAGELNRVVDAAERELAGTGIYYQRGGLIVSVVLDPEMEDAAIKPMSAGSLLRAMSACAIWQRYDGRTGGTVVIDPPGRYVTVLSDAGAYKHLPAITGIARHPHFRSDGTLVKEAGFDVETGRFGVFDPRRFDIPSCPSKADALKALNELKGLLAEFEFGGPEDLAAALAGILTATIRPCLKIAPMFHVNAPVFSSGKSTLCSIFVAFASPTSPSAQAFPTTEDECQKLLLASLLSSPGAIMFDNLTTDIVPYKSLCSALTEEHLTGRILGVSKTTNVGTRVLFLSNGNNVAAVRDMSRRCITISLVPRVETPATRTFVGNPLAALRSDRARFVSLGFTLILAWIAAGRPMTPITPLASFDQWNELVRQPLLWLGMADPAACVFKQIAQDPDRESLGRLLHAWRSEFGTSPTMVREAVSKTREYGNDELRDALMDVAELRGEINTHRLGRWIARHQGRIVDDMRFVKASGTTSAERWSVKSTVLAQSVSFAANHKSANASQIGDVGLITPLTPYPTNPVH